MQVRVITPIAPLDPRRTVPTLGIGRGDPSITVTAEAAWIAVRTAAGPATLCFSDSGAEIEARAWGDGASAALDLAPGLVGAEDDPSGFDPRRSLLRRLVKENPSVRITRSTLVTSALIRAVVGQKVTGKEAKRSYGRMMRVLGEPAPGPMPGLVLPLAPRTLSALTYEQFHPWGIERRRAATVLEVARRSKRLEEASTMNLPDAYRRITALRGVGAWSAALVGIQALGDADAVPVGDFHLPNTVAWALAGEDRADDARMLELLEPFRPHRGRVVRLLKAGGIKAPRYGPRAPLRSIENG